MKIKSVWWILKHEKYGLCPAYCHELRREVVRDARYGFGMSWADMKREGYSAVKVRMSEVKG